MIQYTKEQKQEAVISWCINESPAETTAQSYGTTRRSLYSWREKLLSEEYIAKMPKKKSIDKKSSKEELITEIDKLKNQEQQLKQEVARSISITIRKRYFRKGN